MAYEKVGTMADGSQFDFTTGQVIKPPAPATPETMATPETPASVNRYPLGKYEQAASNFYSNLDTAPPDENAIKENVRKEMQANIDAINRTYDEMSIQESRAGTGREGQTRALGARSGVLGQDFGNAQMDQTKNLNKQAQNAIAEERQIKISGVLNEINKRSEEMIKAKKAEALGNSESYLNFLKTSQTTAREDLKTLAQAGVSIDKLTDEEHTALLEQTGYDPVMLEAVFNANKPKELQVDYKYIETKNGTLVRTGSDGSTKEMGNYSIPEGYEFVMGSDGTPLFVDKVNKTAMIAEGFQQGQFAKPESQNPFKVSAGESVYDPKTGKIIYQAPEKPKEAETKVIGNQLLEKTANGWSVIYTAPTDGKPLTTAEKIALKEKGYEVGGDGELVKTEKPSPVLSANVDLIDEILASPYLSQVTGIVNPFTYWTPGSNEQLVKNQLAQLKANLALANRTQLKGSGQISDFEAKMLEKASSVLGANLSFEDTKKALNKVKNDFTAASLPTNGIQDNGDGTYSYKNNDGSIHTGKNGDNYQDKTQRSSSGQDDLDKALKEAGFSSVGGDTNKAVSKAVNVPDGEKGGQCGAFVNKYTGLGVGDSYQSKLAKMDPSITYPEPGMVFVSPYKDTGHIGFVVGVDGSDAIVKDSNFSLDGKVKTHKIPINRITGFARVG